MRCFLEGFPHPSGLNVRKNIQFKKADAILYLKKKENYDLILIKQSIHFFSKTQT